MPFFWNGKKSWTMLEVLNITVLRVDKERICTSVPLMVTEDASFVIDATKLKHQNDYECDGLGNFRNGGHAGRIFTVSNGHVVDSQVLPRSEKERSRLQEDQYLIKVVYWNHRKHKDFKKRIYKIIHSKK